MYRNYIEVQKNKRSYFLKLDDIVRMESDEKAVRIYTTDGNRYTLHMGINECWRGLIGTQLCLVSRAHIVNVDHIAWMEEDGTLAVKQGDKEVTVPVSEEGKKLLRTLFVILRKPVRSGKKAACSA